MYPQTSGSSRRATWRHMIACAGRRAKRGIPPALGGDATDEEKAAYQAQLSAAMPSGLSSVQQAAFSSGEKLRGPGVTRKSHKRRR